MEDDDDDVGSILHQQRLYYNHGAAPPPMYPHGDDPRAVPPRRRKRRKGKGKRAPEAAVANQDDTKETTATNEESEMIEEFKKAAEEFKETDKALPASDLPEGFPEDLAFRALAVYATLRTLSIQLRLSPFTPNAFLRAVYLPYPNRLLGSVHVHILRILLSNLKMGYHWKDPSTTPTFEVLKKRKIDGIKWPLRAGDNFYYMPLDTWPLFYDDYCHLTADVMHASVFDKKSHIDWRALNLHDIVDPVPHLDDLVDDEVVDSDDDYVFQEEEEEELVSDGDSSFERPKKKQKNKTKAKKKDPIVNKDRKQQESAMSNATQSHRKRQLTAIIPKGNYAVPPHHQNGQMPQKTPHVSSHQPNTTKVYDHNFFVQNYEKLHRLYTSTSNNNHASASRPVPGNPVDRRLPFPNYLPRDFSGRIQHTFSPRNRNADFVTIRDPSGSPQQASRLSEIPPLSGAHTKSSTTFQMAIDPQSTSALMHPMQMMPTARPNFSPHRGGLHMYVHHPRSMTHGPPPQIREYWAHTQPGNLETNAVLGSSRSEEGRRHDAEGLSTVGENSTWAHPERNPVFGTVDHDIREAEQPSIISATQSAVAIMPSVFDVAPEEINDSDASRNPPGNQKPIGRTFGSNENPIEILDNDFDDVIVSDLLDGITWEIQGKSSEADKQVAKVTRSEIGLPKESNSQISQLVASPELTHAFGSAKSENFDAVTTTEPRSESGRRRKYARLEAECKDSSEPSSFHLALKSPFISPKYYDVECIPLEHVPKACNIETTKSHEGQNLPQIQKENIDVASSASVNGSKANLCESSKADSVAMSTFPVSKQESDSGSRVNICTVPQSLPTKSETKAGDRAVPQFVSECASGSLGPPVVSEPRETLLIAQQLSNDIRATTFITAMNDNPVAFRNTNNAFPDYKGITKSSDCNIKIPGPAVQKANFSFSSDTVASSKRYLTDSLQSFIRGKRQSDSLNVGKIEKVAVDTMDDFVAFEVNEPDHWSHMYPLKDLRNGVPYHRLSLHDKILMLEYLVDELLAVDWIAAVFSDRYTKLSRSDFLYGCKPSEEEIKALRDADGDDHDDLCAVCKESGDVVCCDGCVSVYHKGCVGLSISCDPPDLWYCPECEHHDPSSFGPLRGGQKSEVDWVLIRDFFISCLFKRNRELVESKLLVVHGFVFCQRKSDSLFLREDLSSMKRPSQPVLSAKSLQDILFPLGQHFSSKWPMKQVPVNCCLIWGPGSSSSPYENYFKRKEFYDPSVYKNLYFQAPILLENIQRSKQSIAFERNVISNHATSCKLSDCMSPDMTKDMHLISMLLSASNLYDAQHIIKVSLLKLEEDLQKASLLDEFWNSRDQVSSKTWKAAVKHCISFRRLAQLLLQLVDATHVRAFKQGWTHSAIVRSKGAAGKRLRGSDIKKEKGSIQEEALRRHWERGKLCHWTYLVAKSSLFIPDFKKALYQGKSASKRKGIGKLQKHSSVLDEDSNDITHLHRVDECIEKTKSSNDDGDLEALPVPGDEELATANKLRNRKRLDDFTLSISVCDLNIHPSLGGQILEKMTSFSNEAKLLNVCEVRWPYAGKKLFDPMGYLPSSIVRRLGRTGGSLFAPFVEYFSLHEVGQIAYCHTWRKRLSQCLSYEDLVELLRIFESYLDQSTIRQAATFSNRFRPSGGYKTNDNHILFTQRDLLTGLDFHLIEGGGDRPRWVSCLEVDLQALIHDRRSRISRLCRKKETKEDNSSVSDLKINSRKLGEGNRAASSSDTELQGVMQCASRVVADHILEMKKLLKKYENGKIPKAELTKLQQRSDEHLQNIFVGKYSYVGKRQRSEMIAKAEQSVYGKKPVQATSPPNETVTSAVHQTEYGAELDKNSAATTGNLNSERTANATHLLDSKKVSPGLVTIDLMATGTPCDWSKQIISQHKEFTRSVHMKYDYKCLPTNEMESSRHQCVKSLLAIFDVSGIKYSAAETSALVKEAENEVLRDHENSKMDFTQNSLRFVGNRTQLLQASHVKPQIQQVNGTQAFSTSMELDDGYDRSNLPATAAFATRQLAQGERSQERPIPNFLHEQSHARQTMPLSAPNHFNSSDGFFSQLHPSPFHYLPMNHSEQFRQSSTAMPTQQWNSSSASDYGRMTENEALLTQQWPQPSAPLPSSMYNSQSQQNGAQQQHSSFMTPGQYNGSYHNGGNSNWFFRG